MPVFCGIGTVGRTGPGSLLNFDFKLTGGFTSQPTTSSVGGIPGLHGGHETFSTQSNSTSASLTFNKGDIIVCGVGPGEDAVGGTWLPADSNFSITLYIKFESI